MATHSAALTRWLHTVLYPPGGYTQCCTHQVATHSAALTRWLHTVLHPPGGYTQCCTHQVATHSAALTRWLQVVEVAFDGLEGKTLELHGERLKVVATQPLLLSSVHKEYVERVIVSHGNHLRTVPPSKETASHCYMCSLRYILQEDTLNLIL